MIARAYSSACKASSSLGVLVAELTADPDCCPQINASKRLFMMQLHVISPLKQHTSTIICLHGRDSDAATFAEELFESESSSNLTLPQALPGAKWVFPSAPPLRSTVFGCEMSQWFDMRSTQSPQLGPELQREGLQQNTHRICKIIEEEALIVGWDKVLLAGISQGAAVLVHTALSLPHAVGGLVLLSSWFALRTDAQSLLDDSSLTARERRYEVSQLLSDGGPGWTDPPPVFIGHCVDDDVISIGNGRELEVSLKSLGLHPEWHEYAEGGHWLNEPRGVDDVLAFAQKARHLD